MKQFLLSLLFFMMVSVSYAMDKEFEGTYEAKKARYTQIFKEEQEFFASAKPGASPITKLYEFFTL